MSRVPGDAIGLVAGLAAVAGVTLLYTTWLAVSNTTTVALTFLLVVLAVAASSRFTAAAVTSIVAVLSFNFFFFPPVGTFTIADPQNWVALFAFLVVSLVASNLSSIARTRAEEALGRQHELTRLFDLSRDVQLMTDSRDTLSVLARAVARRFDLAYVAVGLPRSGEWDLFESGSLEHPLDRRELSAAFADAERALEFDAYSRTYAGHRSVRSGNQAIRLVPLRSGTRPIGVLAAAGRQIEPGTLDALAGVAAIAIERGQFLEERKQAALTRQSEELKAALLASLGHDLRTPLTAIRVAAANLQASWLGEVERREQGGIIAAEVEHLTRLFDNILDMARIDSGAVAAERRWVHPSEILAAARDQVAHTLERHTLELDVDPDIPVLLDPRLTATALAHLLENAAQYAPPGTTINVAARVAADGLTLRVRDHGPGIAAPDLPHLFERFYRGSAAIARASGTGMGLSIARGLLAVEQGSIWGENAPDGGAEFTMLIPAQRKPEAAPA
jgi:two-component system sensor histidine kinase KdpD